MYTRYFGLTEKPFSIAPDPHFLYLSELHREALAHLLYGIKSDGCLVLLTGEVGTGKTTVSRCLVEKLPESTDIALILNPKLTVIELLATICEELQLEEIEPHNSVKYYIDILNHHLLESHAKGRNTIVIVDEAQDLAPDVLEQLRLLTNLETHKEKLLKIILLGQPELRQLLDQPELSHINQRITSRYHLAPLQEQDVLAYVEHRIRVAGGGRARLFSDKALKRVYELSQGIPRLINLLCDRALLGAYVGEKDQVDQEILEKASYEITGVPRQGKKRHNSMFYRVDGRPALLIWLILALLASGVALAFSYPRLYGILKLHEQSPIATDGNKAPATETAPVILKETEKSEPNEEKKVLKNQRTTKESRQTQKNSKNVEIKKMKVMP